jgi:uncharacterized protein YidB (DUF937 family)
VSLVTESARVRGGYNWRRMVRAAASLSGEIVDLNKVLSSITSNEKVQNAVGNVLKDQNGLGGLINKLGSSGLSSQISSWIGTGKNEPVTAEQVQNALGEDTVAKAAQQAGVSPQQAAEGLAKALPTIVDQASPDGSLNVPAQPAAGQASQDAADLTGSGSGSAS